MHNQTPVQIAWVTHDLDATERSLSAPLGVKKWVRLPAVQFGPETCSYRGQPEEFGDVVKAAEAAGNPVVQQGVMPGGIQFAYVSAAQSGVPYLEIAYIPCDFKKFFDYVKQEQ